MLKEFEYFALKSNVSDLANDVIDGAASGTMVSSLLDGVFVPAAGRALGRTSLADLFIVQSNPNSVPVTSLAIAERRAWRHSISVCSPMPL
jgi:large conductance mechanosensitive channel